MEALTAVLDDIDRSDVHDIICLGDTIGYGPNPNEVIELIQEWNIPTIIGNHELCIIDEKLLQWFNNSAKESLIKTKSWLSEQSMKFIFDLKPSFTRYGCRFVHGVPPESPMTYIFQVSKSELEIVFLGLNERLCFIGHTHIPEIIIYDGLSIEKRYLLTGTTTLDKNKQYIVNVGSVGQPRDGDHDAKYVIWDESRDRIELRAVSYDISSVVTKIKQAGLPEYHATRLL
jgi:diadenosine tetraphosphatase ApaH/serine/threonine PP2A family protein phosphatase